jgi:tetraacyldisaccharide 4'-kinase
MNWFLKQWHKKSLFSYLLLPLSYLYQLVIFLRHLAYRCHFKKITHFSVLVIVVGNITVGGTGKTPFIIWLAKFLREQGYRVGIVSRGYGGKATQYPQRVVADSDARIVGDEAVLITNKTQCRMMVDPNRVAAVKQLLHEHPSDIVLSDDGLQHYALGRDLEIVITDDRHFGNGFCLPAGPLREPVSRLNSVPFILENGRDFNLVPGIIYNLLHPNLSLDLTAANNKTIHAVAGIGNPARFFKTLRSFNLNFIEHPFADHHDYAKKDFQFAKPDDLILMTEKDAVKCRPFADERFWCLPVTAVLQPQLATKLYASIKLLISNKENHHGQNA